MRLPAERCQTVASGGQSGEGGPESRPCRGESHPDAGAAAGEAGAGAPSGARAVVMTQER